MRKLNQTPPPDHEEFLAFRQWCLKSMKRWMDARRKKEINGPYSSE
jgi:hypothetical protein